MILYFLQAGDRGPIKIGITKNLDNRVRQLEKEAPYSINVLQSLPGNRKFEKYLHSKFNRYRVRGEWFEPSEEILFWMDNIIITPNKIFLDPDAIYARV